MEDENSVDVRRHKTIVGVVVSTKMTKTVVVSVVSKVRHPKYKKYVTHRRRFMAHDEQEQCRMGDEIEIVESRPLSRLKRWRVSAIKSRADGVRQA